MELRTYTTSPQELEKVLGRIVARGESLGSWYPVERQGVMGLESSVGCLSHVRVEILVDDEPAES